jgi:hypothetical protein
MNRVNSPDKCPSQGYPSDQLTGTGQPPEGRRTRWAEAELNGQPMDSTIP